MKAVKVQTDGSIRLPKEMLRLFPRASELAVWTEGDMIILKRLTPLKPSEIAQRAPDGEIALEEIAAEVHQMRREKRSHRHSASAHSSG